MGVIKKTLYRGNVLAKPRHRNLFVDMEENIHIHYRDLRIELSRAEFEEFAAIFGKQSQELLAIIREKNYQDGKLPNANQDDVRVWTDSRLQHEVKYHPRRLSIEECGDGYHFHYRNYKLLIDPADFHLIAQLFKRLDTDIPYAASYDEVLALLQDNEIDFVLSSDNQPGQTLAIAVAPHHRAKVRDIFRYLGFAQQEVGNVVCWQAPQLTVKVTAGSTGKRPEASSGDIAPLQDYLSQNAATLDAAELNRIKCQVIDVYTAVRAGKNLYAEVDLTAWLYSPSSKRVIVPCRSLPQDGRLAAETMYKAWSALLARLQLGFIKPPKLVFAPERQSALQQSVHDALRQDVAAFIAVDRIYLMGSALRRQMGHYQVPFVHGKLVKLGSDVDILVEINPARESDIPVHWKLMNAQASNHCAVYHVAQLPMEDAAVTWQKPYPNIIFSHHIVDAYVFFPSHGHAEEKDAFLNKFKAQLFYDRERDGPVSREGEEGAIAVQVSTSYGFQQVQVEKMNASTENALFKIYADGQDYVLKLFKVSGNYRSARVAEHTAYEQQLVTQLCERDIPTAAIIPPLQPRVATIGNLPALLFERIPGTVQQRPEYPLQAIAAALARMHQVQLERPLDLPADFGFDDVCMIWLPLFQEYQQKTAQDQELAHAFAAMATLAERFNPGHVRARLFARSPSLHSHGDVNPKNVIVGADGVPRFFDFNNAFLGPRMADVIDGAYEFSLAEKYIHLADFARFDAFIGHYTAVCPLLKEERADVPQWTRLLGLIKFLKEIRVMLQHPQELLRRKRALAIAGFLHTHSELV